MPVISFASSKGGVGRTTSAIVLATALVPAHRVLLLDADPARRVMAWARKKQLASHLQVQASAGEQMIREELDYARSQADFVILDLEGAASPFNAVAMGESDLVITPTSDEQQEAEAVIETLAELQRLSRSLRRVVPARVLFTRTRATKTRAEKSLNAQLRERLNCFSTELVSRSAFSAVHSYGGPLIGLGREVPGLSKALASVELFAEEVKNVTKMVASKQP